MEENINNLKQKKNTIKYVNENKVWKELELDLFQNKSKEKLFSQPRNYVLNKPFFTKSVKFN